MIPIGLRALEDTSTPRIIDRPYERWERYARADEAHGYFEELAARRHEFGLTARHFKQLGRWIDRVLAMPAGGAHSIGVAPGRMLTPREIVKADPTATLYSWHRADLGYTIATGVSQLLDQSGRGYKLTAPTTSRQPAFNATGINSRPSADFDPTDDFWEYDTGHAALVFAGNDKAWASWSVLQLTGKTTSNFCYIFAAGSSTATQPRVTLFPWNNFNWYSARRDDTNVELAPFGGTAANTTPYFIENFFSGTTTDVIVNGTTVVNAQNLNVGNVSVNRSGIHGVPQSGITASTCARRFGEQIFASSSNTVSRSLMRVYKSRVWAIA